MEAWKKKVHLALISAFFLATRLSLAADPLPVLMGPALRISPAPGQVPDPVLQNLQAVMNVYFQPPYFQGGDPSSPTYLENIYYMSNYFLGNNYVFNPCDDRIIQFEIGQNQIIDFTGFINDGFNSIVSNTLATSYDKGLSWNYGPPVEQIIPLGGTVSEIVNASVGPGLFLEYAKNGTLLASGNGFFDTQPNPPSTILQSGFLFFSSKDNGQSWTPPNIVHTTVDWWIYNQPNQPRTFQKEFYTTVSPSNPQLIHGTTTTQVNSIAVPPREVIFGEILYTRSEDGGKTFSPLRTIYNMFDDPVWQKLHFNPDYISNPNYFIYGGFAFMSAHVVPITENILLHPCSRTYPPIGSTDYTLNNLETITVDLAFVRSEDGGKTWSQIASATEPYIPRNTIFDPGFPDVVANPSEFLIVNGLPAAPYFADGAAYSRASVPSGINGVVVSPFTGRIYLTTEPVNTAYPFASDINAGGVGYSYIAACVSNDQGAPGPISRVNQTPPNPSNPGTTQAFAHNMIMTLDGYLCWLTTTLEIGPAVRVRYIMVSPQQK